MKHLSIDEAGNYRISHGILSKVSLFLLIPLGSYFFYLTIISLKEDPIWVLLLFMSILSVILFLFNLMKIRNESTLISEDKITKTNAFNHTKEIYLDDLKSISESKFLICFTLKGENGANIKIDSQIRGVEELISKIAERQNIKIKKVLF